MVSVRLICTHSQHIAITIWQCNECVEMVNVPRQIGTPWRLHEAFMMMTSWHLHSHCSLLLHMSFLLPSYNATSVYWRVTQLLACSAVSNRNKLKVQTKLNNQSNKKATEKWLFMVGAQLPTPIVRGVQRYPRLSVNHTPEYLREEALMTASGRMFQS